MKRNMMNYVSEYRRKYYNNPKAARSSMFYASDIITLFDAVKETGGEL